MELSSLWSLIPEGIAPLELFLISRACQGHPSFISVHWMCQSHSSLNVQRLLTSLLFIAFFCHVVFNRRGRFVFFFQGEKKKLFLFILTDLLVRYMPLNYSAFSPNQVCLTFAFISYGSIAATTEQPSLIAYITFFLPVMNSLYFTCIHLLNLYTESLQLRADVAFQKDS